NQWRGIPPIRACQRPKAFDEINASARTEVLKGLAGLRIERVQEAVRIGQQPCLVPVGPVRETTVCRAATDTFGRDLLGPQSLTGLGIKRFSETDRIRRVQHAVYHDWRRAEIVGGADLGVGRGELRIQRRMPPGDLQSADAVLVDLFER